MYLKCEIKKRGLKCFFPSDVSTWSPSTFNILSHIFIYVMVHKDLFIQNQNRTVVTLLQKRKKGILLYYYETSGRLVFVCFLEEIEDTKQTFRNYLAFSRAAPFWLS